ncbi:hypothetical protein [Streptomyces sp. KE1]|uniref:hypothetical protein n=1 Tax=Streptomyces sp. KE1 TaxID=1638939 RepID=UPI00063EC46E|nr:hypothetical protein [Streptomyces sp. KE1]KLI94608.1 hypothetical protein WQ59_28610 [Streptomyces sp. KE1]
MADLLWDDVKGFFDPDLTGALPDVIVPGTSVEDWQAALDLVEGSGWTCRYSEGGAEFPVPRAEAVLSRPAEAECAELRVRPTAEILAIFRFHSAEEIDFDVDLRELQGQDRLDVLCDFLTAIGRRLGKPVLMCGEGGASGHPVLGFDVGRDRVELLAEPLVAAEAETRGRAWRPGRPPAQSG